MSETSHMGFKWNKYALYNASAATYLLDTVFSHAEGNQATAPTGGEESV